MKILVITADAVFRKKFQDASEKYSNINVDFAVAADEGILRVKHGHPDLVVVDTETTCVNAQVFFDYLKDEKINIPSFCVGEKHSVKYPLFRGNLKREIGEGEIEKVILSRNAQKKKVLLVDDDRDFVSVIGNVLGGLYDFYYTYDGLSALKVLRKNRPDVVVLDVNLPDINGFRLCQMIREDLESEVKILMLTVRGAESDLRLGAGAGADEYMQKPISNDDLLNKIEKLLKAR